MPTTTSFSAVCATRTTGCPADTTCDARHHAIRISFERGVGRLIGLIAITGRGLLVTGLGGIVVGLMALLFGCADEILGVQLGKTFEVGGSQVAVSLGSRQLGLG
jgi:hypothetical protein